jgi:replication factor C subunit 3/5
MLWVDKYRPSRLDDLSYHQSITDRLKSLAANPDGMPHLLFYGPSGAGKKTRVSALLRQIYGPGADRLKLAKRSFTTPSKRTIEINMVTSNYHIEISPGDVGMNDRFIVQDVIKEMASNKNIAAVGAVSGSTSGDGKKATVQFKTVVLVEVDRLSRQAQAALRRTMEKYSTTCRLILVCNSLSKVIEPVRSRCLGIRVAAPSPDDTAAVLQSVAQKQSLSLPDSLAISIARDSSRNLRRALLMLEACHVQNRQAGFSADQAVVQTDWEVYLRQLAMDVTREQSPARLLAARERLYELLVNCIPASLIIKTLAMELTKNLDDNLKQDVLDWAAFYEHRIALGSKEIFHLEAFLAKFMAIYKKYLNDMFA